MNTPAITVTQISLLAIAGTFGVLLRFAADQLVVRFTYQPHVGTFLINIAGCFIAGAIYSLTVNKGVVSAGAAQVLLVGLCGGFTTFSAYALQALALMQSSQVAASLAYLLLSPLSGLLACFGGYYLFK